LKSHILFIFWTWISKVLNLLDYGWTWTELQKFRTGPGPQNMTVISAG